METVHGYYLLNIYLMLMIIPAKETGEGENRFLPVLRALTTNLSGSLHIGYRLTPITWKTHPVNR